MAVLAIPLLAGFAAGLVAIRRSRTLSPSECALAGLAAGPVAGVLAAIMAWAASGGLGNGHLATLGPTGWAVGAAVAAEVGVVAAATAWVGCPRRRADAVVPVLVSAEPSMPELADRTVAAVGARIDRDHSADHEETVVLTVVRVEPVAVVDEPMPALELNRREFIFTFDELAQRLSPIGDAVPIGKQQYADLVSECRLIDAAKDISRLIALTCPSRRG